MNFLMNLTSLLMVTGRLHQEQEMGAHSERTEKRGARQGEQQGGEEGARPGPPMDEDENEPGADQQQGEGG